MTEPKCNLAPPTGKGYKGSMTHAPNRSNLPPAKSAAEYEREIGALRNRARDLEVAIELSMIDVCTCPIEGDGTERCGGCDPQGTLLRALRGPGA